ncbi:MAG: xanthine dehydrogenase family protein molybdopterin-binding subunit, partial [Deltaproteobacteria bacterium]|nr:xanthine dehydrogenase family protein molybdopterin-binding subunit [Deltaproteobacteria bacterium]
MLINLTRRGFVLGGSAAVFGLALLPGRARGDATAGGLAAVAGGDATPSLFITLERDGRVRLICHRSEMGQQTWTAMAQLLADELEADWSKLEIVQAEGHPRYGDQNTDGSRSVRFNFTRLRTAGAAMRLLLERAAAARWGVAASECAAELGAVRHTGSDRRLSFGELAEAAGALPVPSADEVQLKPRARWRYIGKPQASLTVPRVVRGEGTFGIDVRLPDMLYAVIARPPQVFGAVKSVDDAAALKVPGVVGTVRLPALTPPALFKPLGGVAVLAKDTWAAIQGRKALKVTWDPGPNADYDSARFEEALVATARKPGDVRRNRGDVDAALESAAKKVVAEYYVPHLAHASMEPPAVAARWEGGKVTCWGSVQAPQAARHAVAEACGVPDDAVTIHVTWLGGGFGRKSKPDFFVEAALVAREAKAPVKLTWTREDDLMHGYLHTVSAQRLEGGLDEAGRCTAFLHRTVFPTISSTFN